MKQYDLSQRDRRVLFFPIFLASTFYNILDCLSIIIDEAVVGNLFEDTAFGAINLVEPIKIVESFLYYLIIVGGCAMIVRAHGEADTKKMSRLFSHCVTCCLLLGVIFIGIFTLLRPQLASLVAKDTPALPYVLEVISWSGLNLLLDPLFAFLFTFVLYRNGSLLMVLTSLVQIGSNLGLSVILGKRMGIGGVVFATGLSKILGILTLCLFFLLKKNRIRLRPYLSLNMAKKLSALSFPESSFLLSISLVEAVVNKVALDAYGVYALVAAAAAINMYSIIIYTSEGISEYETVALNEYLGQGDETRIRQSIRISIRAVIIEGLVFSALYVFLANPIVSIFDIDDPASAALASKAIKMMGILPIPICFTRILAIFYQYTDRILRSCFLIHLSWGIFPAAFAFLLSQIAAEGIPAGIVLGCILAMLLVLIYVRLGKREKLWYLSPERIESLRNIQL